MLVVSARRPWRHGHSNSEVMCEFIDVVIAPWPCRLRSYIESALKSQQTESQVLPLCWSLPSISFKNIYSSDRNSVTAVNLFWFVLTCSCLTENTNRKCCLQPSNCVLAFPTAIWGTWQVSEKVRILLKNPYFLRGPLHGAQDGWTSQYYLLFKGWKVSFRAGICILMWKKDFCQPGKHHKQKKRLKNEKRGNVLVLYLYSFQ